MPSTSGATKGPDHTLAFIRQIKHARRTTTGIASRLKKATIQSMRRGAQAPLHAR
jgi:hypothetical protein